MERQYITRDNRNAFYLVNHGMGAAFNPPTHPEHFYSIEEGGRNGGSYSLSYAATCGWLPEEVKDTARRILAGWKPGRPDPAWLDSVYRHFQHCYSPDGMNRNASDCIVYGKFWGTADQEQHANPKRHLGYLFVKK